jgi:uncharacterized protein YfaP (DUF2135 family)
MPHQPRDGKPRAMLALFAALGLGLLSIVFFLTPPAALEVTLRDEVFASDLAGKTARLLDKASGVELALPVRKLGERFVAGVARRKSGPADLELALDGFRPAPVALTLEPLTVAKAAVSLVPTSGRLVVAAVDARDAGAAVTASVTVGGAALPASLSALFPAGKHKVRAEATGYCPAERTALVRERETTRLTVPLAPELSAEERARIILNWGENPRDLDAHVSLADTAASSRLPHVFFSNRVGTLQNGEVFAQLDVDHLHSEGYETITVFDRAPGTYQYFVHRYAGDGTLGDSAAEVEIVTRNCERRRYTVPRTCTQRWWHVADLAVTAAGVTVTDRGECLDTVSALTRRLRKN